MAVAICAQCPLSVNSGQPCLCSSFPGTGQRSSCRRSEKSGCMRLSLRVNEATRSYSLSTASACCCVQGPWPAGAQKDVSRPLGQTGIEKASTWPWLEIRQCAPSFTHAGSLWRFPGERLTFFLSLRSQSRRGKNLAHSNLAEVSAGAIPPDQRFPLSQPPSTPGQTR